MANQVSGGHAPWRRPLLQDYSGVLLFDAVHPVGIYDMQPVTRASAADSAILASAPIQLKQDSDLLNYLRTCYADAQRILRSYEPSPLTLQGPITLIKAGKASPTDRSLSNASRIQRIKTHLCPYNGWKKLAEQPGVKWLTIPLANTAHDNLFIEPHLGRVQAAIDEIELAQRI
ncbi:hypothetical protein [Sporisorium scitamineum]|nr:hypothetical protein [Sporisorium scitamineum]